MADETSLPPDTYAIMVHKTYQKRVTDFLSTRNSWDESKTANFERLFQESLTGVSRARRGFVLILVKETQRPIEALSPLARQNISWLGRLQFTSLDTFFQHLKQTINSQRDKLRVQVHPVEMTEDVCLRIQRLFDEHCEDPFEGPVVFTLSRTNCTHRITVIVQDGKELCGIESRILVALNHFANDEIIIKGDRAGEAESTVPLSRAYYKLEQVFDEYLQNKSFEGNAIDMGASPGGWTQVLVHKAKVNHVVAVDPGVVSARVTSLPNVTHIRGKIQDADLDQYGPYSMFVCDACIIWGELFKLMSDIFDRFHARKTQTKTRFLLPFYLIVTLKLPFKTQGSVDRHLAMIHEEIPTNLEQLTMALFGRQVNIRYKVAHLMANSDGERTLIAKFQDYV